MFLSLGLLAGAILLFFGYRISAAPDKATIAVFVIKTGWGAIGISIAAYAVWKAFNRFMR